MPTGVTMLHVGVRVEEGVDVDGVVHCVEERPLLAKDWIESTIVSLPRRGAMSMLKGIRLVCSDDMTIQYDCIAHRVS